MKKLVIFLNNPVLNLDLPLRLDTTVLALLSESVEQESFALLGERSFQSLIDELASDINNRNLKTYFIIPSEQSLNCLLKVPTKASRQIQKALPYLVEDHIAVDPDLCFIASGELKGNTLPCNVIDRDLLCKYQAFFESTQLNCERIISFTNLHFEPEASLHVFDDKVLLISSEGERFSFNLELLPIYLSKLITEEDKQQTAQQDRIDDSDEVITSDELDSNEYLNKTLPVYLYESETIDSASISNELLKQVENFSKTHDFPYQAEIKHKPLEDFYKTQAQEITKRGQDKRLINFLQGEFKVKQLKEGGFQINANWQPTAYLLLALVLISLLSLFLDIGRYEKGAELANQQTKQLFKQIFPETKNYSSMRKRVSALIGGPAESGNQFLALMVGFSEGMSVINKKSPDSLTATRFQYEQNNSQLRIDIDANSFDTLNELKTLLGTKGFLLEIASTSTETNGVKGRLNFSFAN